LVATASALGAVALVTGGGAEANATDTDIVLKHGGYHDIRFEIAGTSVRGLYPGAVRKVTLTFTNPTHSALRVQAVKGTLISTSKVGCAPSPANLEVGRYSERLPMLLLPKSRRNAGHVAIRMPNSVGDACQNVKFIIRITGHATTVGR
jgi:hypothetical protein